MAPLSESESMSVISPPGWEANLILHPFSKSEGMPVTFCRLIALYSASMQADEALGTSKVAPYAA